MHRIFPVHLFYILQIDSKSCSGCKHEFPAIAICIYITFVEIESKIRLQIKTESAVYVILDTHRCTK